MSTSFRHSSFHVPAKTPVSTSPSDTTHPLRLRHPHDYYSFATATPYPTTETWMHGTSVPHSPFIRINDNAEFQYPEQSYQDFSFDNTFGVPQEWQMYQGYNNSTGGAVPVSQNSSISRGYRGHARQASDSTIASAGPDSPYTNSASYPFIAGTDRSPTSATYPNDEGSATFSKTPTFDSFHPFSVGYMPSQLSHTPAAHSAMKNMAIDHHNAADEVPDFASSRRSESSHGRNSPSTPRTGDESDEKAFKAPSNDYRQGPRVELYRTESAACQDELYNPANFLPSASTQPRPQQKPQDLLSPHRNLVNERIRTANDARTQSPAQGSPRDRSPFRQGSPLAPTDGYRSPAPIIGTAAASRQQQKAQADAMEYRQHQPQLRREPTKTISPKDALLDYNESDQDGNMSLFQDTIPAGYQRHYGGTENFPNNFVSGTNQAYGQFATSSQPTVANFRATSSDGATGNTTNYNFLPPSAPNQVSSNSLAPQQYRTINPEGTPEFPAHLTSMESSMSENGAPPSSQESAISMQRPPRTTADTGTYTCTYHGCIQRFESPAKLQRHKREAHQPTHDEDGESDATSPKSSVSPGPSGMTSSSILARNSQAGPHKCTRINPSTNKPCNTIFSRPYDLTRHEDTIHNRVKQKVACQYCTESKTFSRNDALTRHMRVVHPEIDFQGKRNRTSY